MGAGLLANRDFVTVGNLTDGTGLEPHFVLLLGHLAPLRLIFLGEFVEEGRTSYRNFNRIPQSELMRSTTHSRFAAWPSHISVPVGGAGAG